MTAAAEKPERSASRFRRLARGGLGRPIVVAHRGDSAHAPENTIEAALKGWEAGADAWELDVHLTRDRVPVIVHDESLDRTTDVARRFARDPRGRSGFLVSDFDLEEIRSLDAGSWFLEPEGKPRSAAYFGTAAEIAPADRRLFGSGSVRVPTLVEALRLTARLDWLVNVELKSFPNPDRGLFDAVLAAVEETATSAQVLISSFDHADVGRLTATHPEIASAVLVSTPLYRPEQYVREIVLADFYHPSAAALGAESDAYRRAPAAASLRIDDLRALAEADIPVLVYTVNDPRPDGLAAHLAQAGVRGVFSDDPGRIKALYDVR